jgi:capsular polysaccharide transport system ATP-binding protein
MSETCGAGMTEQLRGADPAPGYANHSTAKAISVENLVKCYRVENAARRVLDGISFSVAHGEKMGILGRNGAGKSSLIRLLAGIESPTSGKITRSASLSWPIALSGGFSGSMSGNDCARFIARIYNRSFAELRDFVEDFTELGKYMRMPVRTYSSGMLARLAFGLSLVVDFDCYLIDEVLSVGDRKFRSKCFEELFVKRGHAAMIIVSHDLEILSEFCSSAMVLKSGRGRVFSDIRFAYDIYASL